MKARNKGLSISYIYFVLNTIITVFVSAFIVRKIGQTNYGVYQTVSAFASYLILLEFGTGTAMTRNISLLKKDGSDVKSINRNVSTIWYMTVLLAVLIFLVSVVFYANIDNIYCNSLSVAQIKLAKRVFVFVDANLVLSFFTQTLNGLLLGYEYYTFEKTVSITKLLVRSCLLFVLLGIFPDIILIVSIDATISCVIFLVTFLFCVFKLKVKFHFKYFDKKVFRFTMPLCLAMLLQTIVNTANGNVDKFAISVMMSPNDVSIYAISMTIFTMYSSIGCIPLTMFMPQIAKKMNEGIKEEKLTDILIQPCRLNTLILGVLAFGIFVVGRQFLQIVYGDVYGESWIYAIVVILPMLFNMFNGVIINIMDILNKRQIRSFILLITTALNVVLTIFGIKYIGMIGAALATGISLILQTIILNIYYYKKLKINSLKLFNKSFKGILLFLIIAAIISYPIKYVIQNIYLQFFVCGFVFCVVFVLLFIKFGTNEQEKDFILKIKSKV